jgi:serralysin
VLRMDPTSTAADTQTITPAGGSSLPNPMYQDTLTLPTLAAQVDGGQITLAQALTTIEHYGDATTSVATIAYEFFTGKTPTAGGYNYLINSAANPDNLNSAYYAQFNEENRYINFAVNLGKDGAGMANFQRDYGGLNLHDAMTQAYTTIFGFAPAAGKIDGLLSAQITPTETRADYFAAYGLDGPGGQGTKAAAVGWLMVEAVKADLGTYAQANDHFLAALAGGTAQYNVDLLSVYATAASQSVSTVGVAAHVEAAHGLS